MNVKLIKTSSCESTYEVDGVKLRLWVITGGEPAMSFEDYSFSKRYPIIDKRWQAKWNGRYPHQIGQNPIQGPAFDILPKGIKSVKEYLEDNIPLKELREKRFFSLPIQKSICSKGFKDKENHTIVKFKINLQKHYISPLIAQSNAYCGRCDDEIEKYAPEVFKKYAAFANPLFDNSGASCMLEALTENQFQTFVSILAEINLYINRIKK